MSLRKEIDDLKNVRKNLKDQYWMANMKEQPLISVIVPIYCVVEYLEKCVDSIIQQTYSNLEIILVDDGSPDECPEICDEYVKKDSRIKVIHKKNGGLSDARNAGLDIATGEYIGFIDSDDWILPDMYEYMFNEMQRHDADLSVCEYYLVNGKKISATLRDETRCFIGKKAKYALLRLEFGNYAWNKLYKKELWEGIRFPVGKNYEDVLTMYKIITNCNKVILLPIPKYYYVINNFGIIKNKSIANKISCVKARMERFEDLENEYKNKIPWLFKEIYNYTISLRDTACKCSNKEFKKQITEIKYVTDFLIRYKNEFYKNCKLAIHQKITFNLLTANYRLLWKFSFFLSKMNKLRKKLEKLV